MRRPTRTLRRRAALATVGALVLSFGVAPAALAADLTGEDDPVEDEATDDSDPVEQTTTAVDDTVEDSDDTTVTDTVDDTLATVEETATEIVAEPSEEPSDEPSDDPGDGGDDGGQDTDEAEGDRTGGEDATTTAADDGDTQTAAADDADAADGDDTPDRPLPAAVTRGPRMPGLPSPLEIGGGAGSLDLALLAGTDASGPRATGQVLELLELAGADAETVARLLAPFPLAGPASYEQTSRPPVELSAPAGTPVIAATRGTVTVTTGDVGTMVELTATDGTRYRYDGLQTAVEVADGDKVRAGQVLGRLGAAGQLRFSLWGPGGDPLVASDYLDRWLAEALEAARLLADARGGAFSPQVAPAETGEEAPGPRAPTPLSAERPPAQSSFAPAGADGQGAPTGLVLLGMLVTAVLGYRILRPRPSAVASGEGFLEVTLHDPRD